MMRSFHSIVFVAAASISFYPSLSHAVNITIYQPGVDFAPLHLPAPGAASNADQIVELFSNLGRSTVWKSIKNITFEGDSDEPEGMARIGSDRYFVSTTETLDKPVSYGNITNGTDRSTGDGFAHIIVYDGEGKRIAKSTYNKPGDIEYHLGGIDYDGSKIWGTLAQYRPNTTAQILEIDPKTLEATSILKYKDHLGGIVHDTHASELYTLNWGARNASKWELNGKGHSGSWLKSSSGYSTPSKVTRNPSYFADYQDCKFLGRPRRYNYRGVMICSGVTAFGNFSLGGLAIVDLESMTPLDEVPIVSTTPSGVVLTQNPTDFEVVDGKLRAYFLPEQHNSTLYIFDAEPQSPYEY